MGVGENNKQDNGMEGKYSTGVRAEQIQPPLAVNNDQSLEPVIKEIKGQTHELFQILQKFICANGDVKGTIDID